MIRLTALIIISSVLLTSSCIFQPPPPAPTPILPTPQPQTSSQDTTPPELKITSIKKEATDGNELTFTWAGNKDEIHANKLTFAS